MSVPDAVVAAVLASLPSGAYLWNPEAPQAIQETDLVVFDGLVPPQPPKRYVVVYADDGTRDALAVCSESDSATYRWQTTAVGPSRSIASGLAVQVLDGIVDVVLNPEGWACGPVRHTFSQLPQRDEQVRERLVVYAVDQYSLLASRRAPAEV